ncbi:MAG TPA: (Fe-S)-binding protein [Burkholderiales bacterium]|nr:(Fe-S)-binding protein [Burkholderiales bacterium]
MSAIQRLVERAGEERVAAAMQAFARDFTREAAVHMDACVHCGHCSHACHFYVSTRDPKYTPINKIEPFVRAYRRSAAPWAPLARLFGLEKPVTLTELERWQELIYDACTMCGRCTLVCPMGIDIAALIARARHGMFAAGLVPADLGAVAERAEREMSPLGATPKVLAERIEWLTDEHGIKVPLDAPRADVLITLSSIEIMKYPQSLVALARVLEHVGESWTISTRGYEATNFGMLSGNREWQRDMSERVIDAAIACGVKTVVVPECGHAYGALRWEGANVHGAPLPFKVLHISEYLAALIESGKLRLKPLAKSLTFHDPCQVSRRGGAAAAPRRVLAALGVELRELADHADAGWCCGGGGGVVAIKHADDLRHGAFRIKMREIDATGAEIAATSCANCRQSFDDGQAYFKWDTRMQSLLELVAQNLQERAPAPLAR